MNNKVIFANNLRGIAAILVLISHFLGVFVSNPNAVHELLHIDQISHSHNGLNLLFEIVNFNPVINYGHFGVALFFLISGFVIPFSLTKYPPHEICGKQNFAYISHILDCSIYYDCFIVYVQ